MSARMPGPPHAHPLHVFRSAEVVPVPGFTEPAALPCRIAHSPAGALRAVLLPPAIAHIHGEKKMSPQHRHLLCTLFAMGPPRRPIFADRRGTTPAPWAAVTGGKKIDAE